MNGYFCEVCGKGLTGKQRKACSKQCLMKRQWRNANAQIKKTKPTEKKKTIPKYTIAEINKMARVENLTYGQFMAKYRDKII